MMSYKGTFFDWNTLTSWLNSTNIKIRLKIYYTTIIITKIDLQVHISRKPSPENHLTKSIPRKPSHGVQLISLLPVSAQDCDTSNTSTETQALQHSANRSPSQQNAVLTLPHFQFTLERAYEHDFSPCRASLFRFLVLSLVFFLLCFASSVFPPMPVLLLLFSKVSLCSATHPAPGASSKPSCPNKKPPNSKPAQARTGARGCECILNVLGMFIDAKKRQKILHFLCLDICFSMVQKKCAPQHGIPKGGVFWYLFARCWFRIARFCKVSRCKVLRGFASQGSALQGFA